MAVSLPDARALLLSFVLLAPAAIDAASPRAMPRGTDTSRVLNIDAASSEIDYGSNHLIIRDVTLSQGALSIRAREAEANGPELSFDGSQWEFRGDVRIRFEGGSLEAERATVSFVGNRASRARASGTPTQFEQKLDNRPEPARGRAGNIDYDISAGRLTLNDDIWLTDGRNEWRSESIPLIYSVRERRVQSGGEARPDAPAPTGNGGRIHITIQPEEPESPPEPPTP